MRRLITCKRSLRNGLAVVAIIIGGAFPCLVLGQMNLESQTQNCSREKCESPNHRFTSSVVGLPVKPGQEDGNRDRVDIRAQNGRLMHSEVVGDNQVIRETWTRDGRFLVLTLLNCCGHSPCTRFIIFYDTLRNSVESVNRIYPSFESDFSLDDTNNDSIIVEQSQCMAARQPFAFDLIARRVVTRKSR
jgi:hypothetical protein